MRVLTVALLAVPLLLPAIPVAQAQEFVWARGFGGSSDDRGFDVVLDDDKNLLSVGYFRGTADFDPGPGTFELTSAGEQDGYIVKLDNAGNLLWARNVGGSGDDTAYSVGVDADGNVFVVGTFEDTADFDPGPGSFPLTSAGVHDTYVLSLDDAGEFVWAGQFSGPYDVYGMAVTVDHAGDVYVTGSFSSVVDFDPGPGVYNQTAIETDMYLVKLDGSGGFVWARRVGGPVIIYARAAAVDGGGNIYAIGDFKGMVDFDPGPLTYNVTSGGGYDGFLLKLDSAGEFVWADSFSGADEQLTSSLGLDEAGFAHVMGHFEETVDFDPGPGTYELTAEGGFDAFVCKVAPDGELVWVRRLGGPLSDTAWGGTVDVSGNVYATGGFEGTVDFDPGPGTFYLTPDGEKDAYLLKLDGAGKFVRASRFGGPSSGPFAEVATVVAADASSNAYVGGYFRGTVDFDPGPGTFPMTPAGYIDAFVVKLSSCGEFTESHVYGRLLFAPRCTTADVVPPGVYDEAEIGLARGADDGFFLSSAGAGFAPLVADSAVHVDGQDSGLGPYAPQPGASPAQLNVPIEDNLVPLPAHDVTLLIPAGSSNVLFELLETQDTIYGNTAVYLVRDCGIYLRPQPRILDPGDDLTIRWVSHEVEIGGAQSDLDVVTGLVSELRADGGFDRATCLGQFTDTSEVVDDRPAPPLNDGYYYLVDGTCGEPIGYGDSSIVPDPRDLIAACP